MPSSASSAIWPLSKGWTFNPLRATPASASWSSVQGPAVLSAAYHLANAGHHVTVHEAAAKLGGMMRYANPRVSSAALGGGCGNQPHRADGRGIFKTDCKTENLDAFLKDGRFRRGRAWRSARSSANAWTSRPVDAGKILDALKFLATAPTSGPLTASDGASPFAAAATRPWTRRARRCAWAPSESIIIYRRDQAHMPAHRIRVRRGACKKESSVNWLRTVKEVDDGEIQVEVMQLDAKGKPQPTGKFETLKRRHADSRPGPGDRRADL
jgi:formate dehydrogenase beta subunit